MDGGTAARRTAARRTAARRTAERSSARPRPLERRREVQAVGGTGGPFPFEFLLGSALRFFLVVRRFWGFVGFWLVLMDYGLQTVPIYSPQNSKIYFLLVDKNLPQTVQSLF